MKWFSQFLIFNACCIVNAASFAVPNEVVVAGWSPAVTVLADGDSHNAIKRMRQYTELQHTLFHNIDLHPQTKSFLDKLWDSLESFNLYSFHDTLPERTANKGHQLRVYGGVVDGRYPIGPTPVAGMQTNGEPVVMGNFSGLIQSHRIADIDEAQFLLEGSAQLGVGDITWPAVEQAFGEILRISTGQNPVLQDNLDSAWLQPYKAKVKQWHPKLNEEDIAILAPLWASYPALAELIAQFGEVEDIIYFNTGLPYRRFNGSFRLDPERIKQHYPHLSKHLTNFHRLFKGSLRLSDARGDLLSVDINSKTLRGQINMYVADGRILPIHLNKVLLDAPEIPHDKPWEYTAHMQAKVSVWGVNMHLQQAKARVQTYATNQEFKLVGQITEVPKLSIDGAALGIFPTWMAEIPLPTTFHEIINEFLSVACRGNDGKGVLAGMHFKPATSGETSNLIIKAAFEGLQNFFVRFGMGIVADRALPDARAQNELEDLFYDVQDAFASDLKGFETALLGQNSDLSGQQNKAKVVIPSL